MSRRELHHPCLVLRSPNPGLGKQGWHFLPGTVLVPQSCLPIPTSLPTAPRTLPLGFLVGLVVTPISGHQEDHLPRSSPSLTSPKSSSPTLWDLWLLA